MQSQSLERLLEQIVSVNHAWKLSREEFGNQFVATKSLLGTKSSLQATLLREFPMQSRLVFADDNYLHEEPLFSVRLIEPVKISSGLKRDAEHLPVRVAKALFTEFELEKLVDKGQ